MTVRNKHIMPPGNRKISSFIKGIIVLCLTMLFFQQDALFAQVLSNSGAVMSVTSGTVLNGKDIENTAGTISNNGTINLSGNYTNAGTTDGNGAYNIAGNWTNTGTFTPGTSTVTFNGAADQTITHGTTGETFYKLSINKTSGIVTQIANAGNTLSVTNNLDIISGGLSLGSTTSALTVGGTTTIDGALTFNNLTTQTATLTGALSGTGTIDMSGGNLPHVLNLAGTTNAITTFTTSASGSSTVNYNGTSQTVFSSANYRNLTISGSGTKTLQGNSTVGIDLDVSAGTFDLGTATTILGVGGGTSIDGSLNFNGTSTKTVSLTGNLSGTGTIDMSGGNLSHLLNLGGVTNNIGTLVSGTGGTVDYTLNGDQAVLTSDNYRNLRISGSGVKTLGADITASGVLTMSSGDINSNGNTLILTNSTTGAIVRTSGKVLGKLQRNIGLALGVYLLPIGSASNYNPLNLTINAVPTAGSLLSEFINVPPGNAGLPLTDGLVEVADAYTDGYWSLTANGFSCGDYSISLDGSGFSTPVFDITRVIKRTAGGNWILDGTHSDAIGSVCYRNNLTGNISSSGTHFGLGHSRPKITGQPVDETVCEATNTSFTVTATGYPTLTYKWYKAPNIPLIEGGRFTGTNLATLNIANVVLGDAGNYYCIVTDGHGNFTQSNSALLTINPLPTITLDPVTPVCNTSNSFSLPYSAITNSPTTYSITAGTPAMPGFTPVTDAALPASPIIVTIPTGVAENNYQFIITVRNANGCVSTSQTFNVTDYENQVAAAGGDQNICGSLSSVFAGNIPSKGTGIWTYVSGPDPTPIFGNFNSATSSVTVTLYGTYIFRWTLVNGSCQTQDDVTIWFDPTPAIAANNDTICNNEFTSILPQTSTTNALFGVRYTWTTEDVDNIINGETSSVGNGYQIGKAIKQQLNNPDNASHKVIYHITPWTIRGDSSLHCIGNIIDIDVWVEPTVVITAVNDTICNNTATGILPISSQTTTNGIRYTWTVVDNPNITGESNSAGKGQLLGTAIVQTLVNTSNNPQRVTYTITPWTIDNNGNNRCAGVQLVVYAWIEPTARVTGTISNDTICNNDPISIILASPTTSIYGVRFNVTIINPYPEITGYSNRTNLTTASVINENINNSGDTARMIMYVIRPATLDVFGSQRCIGVNDTIRLWINPTPRVIPINARAQICFGGTTDITLTTPSAMTKGVIRFDYTVTVTGVGVVIGNTTPGNNLIPGQKILFSYQNNSDTIQSVFYAITPKVVGLGCPVGNINSPEVKIHAKPLQGIVITKPLTCDGGSDASLRGNISKGAGPYQIIWDGPFNFHREGTTNITNIGGGRYDIRVTDNLSCTNTDFIFVEGAYLDSYLDVTTDATCPGYSDGILRIRVNNTSTGTAPFEYRIVHDYQDTVIYGTLPVTDFFNYHNGLAAGNYKLYLRDINGCYDNNFPEVNVLQPEVITVTFAKSQYQGGFNVSCKGYNDGSVWINTISGGNGGYTYEWYTFDGTIPGNNTLNRLDGITAGKYYLKITDIKGCEKVDSVIITEPNGIQLATSQLSSSADSIYNISCNGGNDGSIKITLTGGSGSYNFSWSGPNGFTATSKDISGLRAGTYVATITDLANITCILMPQPTFTLTEPAALNIGVAKSLSTDGSYNINCNGGTGTINLTLTGGSVGTYKYNWSTANGSGLINGQEDQNALAAGTYHVAVTDSNLCVASTDIVLTQPAPLSATFIPTHITCQSPGFDNGSINLTVTGGVGSYTYSWSNGASTKDITNLIQGYYRVTVRDNNGCQKIDSVRIDLPPDMTYASLLSSFNGYNISCFGLSDGSIQITPLTGKSPYSYSWQGPNGFTSANANISGLRAGQYILQITDANLCTATGIFNLTEPGKLNMTIAPSTSSFGGFNINCVGDSTGSININPVNNVGTVNYLWSDGATGKLRSNLPAGTYDIIITDQNSCHADSTVVLTQPDSIKTSLTVRQAFCPDSPDGEIQLSVTGGVIVSDYSFNWSDNSKTQDLTNILRGLYKVTVTDANNCSVKDSVKMEPLNESCLIIPNAISPNDDNINDVWNIGMIYLYPQIEIKIFNRWGELLWKSEKGYPHPWDGRSNGTPLPIDSYHYVIDLHNGSKPIIGNVTIVR